MAHAKLTTENELLLIERKVESYFADKVNSNVIIDLLQSLLSKNENVIYSAIHGLEQIFQAAIADGNITLDQPLAEIDLEGCSMEEKFKIWHYERFSEAVDELLLLTKNSSKKVQEQSFVTLLRILLAKHEKLAKTEKEKSNYFSSAILTLLDDKTNMNNVITKYTCFKDHNYLHYNTLKIVISHLKERLKTKPNFIFLENVFNLLEIFNTILAESDGTKNQIKKKYSTAWITFLKFNLSPSLYKKVLIILHKKVMPNLTNPLLLTDFLTDSYNIGGVVSLLALNGLFLLIQKYNLEYPEFYTKLYALLTDVIFYAKYRARFFYLTDLFLSSTHLPAYLVAAFAKRLSRLALIAPPDMLLTLIPFIGNLLVRHPSLAILVDNPDAQDVNDDPYLYAEKDPSLCNAIQSSLWEIKSLQNHWHPEVARKAAFINKQLPKMEWDLSDVLEIRHTELFEKELEGDSKFDSISLSYHRPNGFFTQKEDQMDVNWML